MMLLSTWPLCLEVMIRLPASLRLILKRMTFLIFQLKPFVYLRAIFAR
jgi:hypothetical protein